MKRVCSIALLIVANAVLRANTVAQFDEGDAKAFPGEAGVGWVGAWSVLPEDGADQQKVSASVESGEPLADKAGGYLVVRGEGKLPEWGLSRQYGESSGEVTLDTPHVISWSFRIDDPNLGGFTGAWDRYQFFEDGKKGGLTSATNDWAIIAVGANQEGPSNLGLGPDFSGARKWLLIDGAGANGKIQDLKFVDTGITLEVGVTYRFTVTTDPRAGSWSAEITSSTGEHFKSDDLGWRRSGDGKSGAVLNFSVRSANAAAHRIAIDNVAIDRLEK